MPNWPEEVFTSSKIKNTVPWTLQKTNQKEFRIEKVLKKKGDKLYVKRKGYDNSFNSWIDKKYLV